MIFRKKVMRSGFSQILPASNKITLFQCYLQEKSQNKKNVFRFFIHLRSHLSTLLRPQLDFVRNIWRGSSAG
jgi:hypothetical protein